jgi:hypothetical protein
MFMKKFTLLATLLICGLTNLAQNNAIIPVEPIEQSKFSIGIKGAFGHSFIIPYKDFTFNPSWDAGLSAVFSPWAHWGIGLDATYSAEGSSVTQSDVTNTTEYDYIRVPIKAIYFFNTYEKDLRPKITLGPCLGFLVNERNSLDASSFDLGANISAGVNYRLMRAVWLSADVNYYQGFLDVNTLNSQNEFNGNVRINLGLSFGF